MCLCSDSEISEVVSAAKFAIRRHCGAFASDRGSQNTLKYAEMVREYARIGNGLGSDTDVTNDIDHSRLEHLNV